MHLKGPTGKGSAGKKKKQNSRKDGTGGAGGGGKEGGVWGGKGGRRRRRGGGKERGDPRSGGGREGCPKPIAGSGVVMDSSYGNLSLVGAGSLFLWGQRHSPSISYDYGGRALTLGTLALLVLLLDSFRFSCLFLLLHHHLWSFSKYVPATFLFLYFSGIRCRSIFSKVGLWHEKKVPQGSKSSEVPILFPPEEHDLLKGKSLPLTTLPGSRCQGPERGNGSAFRRFRFQDLSSVELPINGR